jgi:ribosome biogenesis protein YTM1
MTLFDPRSDDSASDPISSSFLHPATPSCVSISESGNQVVTGAYDGVVRVWDLRSAKGTIASFKVWDGEKKVLDIDWKRGVVGIAGEGGVEVWKVGEDTTT